MVDTFKWSSVTSTEVVESDYRLEATVFNIDARNAKETVEKYNYGSKFLGELLNGCYYGGRLKRNYIDKYSNDAIGFLGSSEMLAVLPKPEKYISKTDANIEQIQVKKNTILISRSGTIGNLTLVNDTLSKFLVSEHAIRIETKEFPGFLYAYFKTDIGQALIKSNIYGAVVDQIEPEHLATIKVPDFPSDIKRKINKKIIDSFSLRDVSNEKIIEAEQILVNQLELEPLNELNVKLFDTNIGFQNFSVQTSFLEDRFDASFHIPIANAILDLLGSKDVEVLSLGDRRLTKQIILPGRFKRHYVPKDEGIVFLGGKQIYELDPSNKKYLSPKLHQERIASQLFLHENMIVITCSGTIGKVNIIPKHWENWTMSQHVLRAIPVDDSIAGYLYIWLNSDYGKVLINRFTYGSVVDEIDDNHLSEVQVPVIKDTKVMRTINELALSANALRSQAYYLEQKAIKQVVDGLMN